MVRISRAARRWGNLLREIATIRARAGILADDVTGSDETTTSLPIEPGRRFRDHAGPRGEYRLLGVQKMGILAVCSRTSAIHLQRRSGRAHRRLLSHRAARRECAMFSRIGEATADQRRRKLRMLMHAVAKRDIG